MRWTSKWCRRPYRCVKAKQHSEVASATVEKSSAVNGSLRAQDANRYYRVRLIDLPALLRQRQPKRLLLKLDVEGEEKHIIPALFDALPRGAAIFFETHHGEAEWDIVKQLFAYNGFAVERRRSVDRFIDGFALRH